MTRFSDFIWGSIENNSTIMYHCNVCCNKKCAIHIMSYNYRGDFQLLVEVSDELIDFCTRDWIEASVANLLGAVRQSGRFLSIPAAVVPDST